MAQRKRPRLDLTRPASEQFQVLRSISKLNKETCREILSLLHSDGATSARRTCSRTSQIYPDKAEVFKKITVGTGNDTLELPVLNLPAVVQKKVTACPFFSASLQDALDRHGNIQDILVFWDETTPGNVLNPDLQRKSALTYFTFPGFKNMSLDTCWVTFSLIRTREMQRIPEGATQCIAAILEEIREQTLQGFMIDFNGRVELIKLGKVIFLADADGLRIATGAKGSAALKPCWKCSNVVSGDRLTMENHERLSSSNRQAWIRQTRDSIQQICRHLDGLVRKSHKKEAETLLGWNAAALTHSFLLKPSLRTVLALEDVLYDPMHVYVGNGIVGQELGYFFKAMLEKTNSELQHLRNYASRCWKSCGHNWVDQTALFDVKLWPLGRDCRAEASDTLSILPLVGAFSHEVLLPVNPDLSPEVTSLTALFAVIIAWLRAKHGRAREEASKLASAQDTHIARFLEAYDALTTRPKLHFGMHIPEQCATRDFCPDAFSCERKNKEFKSIVAPNLTRLKDFSEVALLEMCRIDTNMSVDMTPQTCLADKPFSSPDWARKLSANHMKVTKNLLMDGVEHGAGQYKVVNASTAVEVLGACDIDGQHFLLCYILHCTKTWCSGFTDWERPIDADLTLLAASDIRLTTMAAYFRRKTMDVRICISLLCG
eukprot:Skav222178  [mRNA]  locus=scaffold3784:42209:44188:- [translate_table: standard]